jgi:GTP-binding protein EngB required for normal cell division
VLSGPGRLIRTYLRGRQTLRRVLVLVDAGLQLLRHCTFPWLHHLNNCSNVKIKSDDVTFQSIARREPVLPNRERRRAVECR